MCISLELGSYQDVLLDFEEHTCTKFIKKMNCKAINYSWFMVNVIKD